MICFSDTSVSFWLLTTSCFVKSLIFSVCVVVSFKVSWMICFSDTSVSFWLLTTSCLVKSLVFSKFISHGSFSYNSIQQSCFTSGLISGLISGNLIMSFRSTAGIFFIFGNCIVVCCVCFRFSIGLCFKFIISFRSSGILISGIFMVWSIVGFWIIGFCISGISIFGDSTVTGLCDWSTLIIGSCVVCICSSGASRLIIGVSASGISTAIFWSLSITCWSLTVIFDSACVSIPFISSVSSLFFFFNQPKILPRNLLSALNLSVIQLIAFPASPLILPQIFEKKSTSGETAALTPFTMKSNIGASGESIKIFFTPLHTPLKNPFIPPHKSLTNLIEDSTINLIPSHAIFATRVTVLQTSAKNALIGSQLSFMTPANPIKIPITGNTIIRPVRIASQLSTKNALIGSQFL